MRRTLTMAAAFCGTVSLYAGVVRRQHLRWGATRAEVALELPGDDLLPRADLMATRAITVRVPPERVWPWIAQLGQGRGGFYSYDVLENLAGCNIHSATEVVEAWQRVRAGDEVRLAPEVPLSVALVEPGRTLVLRGAVPMGEAAAPPYDFTWTFTLRSASPALTRLIVRERYAYTRPWARFLVEPVELISFVMSQKMLRGIRDRAENVPPARPEPHAPAPGRDFAEGVLPARREPHAPAPGRDFAEGVLPARRGPHPPLLESDASAARSDA